MALVNSMKLRKRISKKPASTLKKKKRRVRKGKPGRRRGRNFHINMKYRIKKAERLAQSAQHPVAPAPTPIVVVPQLVPTTSPQARQARKKKPGRKRGPGYFKNLEDRTRREAAKQAAKQAASAQVAQQAGAPAPAPGKPGRPRGPNYDRNLRWRKKVGPTGMAQQTAPLPVVQVAQQPAAVTVRQPRPKKKSKKGKAQKKQKDTSKENGPPTPAFHPDDVFLLSDRQIKAMEKKGTIKPIYRENRQYKKKANRNAVAPAPLALAVVVDRARSTDLIDHPVAVDNQAGSPEAAGPPIDVEDAASSSPAAPPAVFAPMAGPSAAADPVNPAQDDLDPVNEGSNDSSQQLHNSESWNFQGDFPIDIDDRAGSSFPAASSSAVVDLAGPSDLDGSSTLVDPIDKDEEVLPGPIVDPAVTSLAINKWVIETIESGYSDPPIGDSASLAAVVGEPVDPQVENRLESPEPVNDVDDDLDPDISDVSVCPPPTFGQFVSTPAGSFTSRDALAEPSSAADPPVAVDDLDGSPAVVDPVDEDEEALAQPLVSPALSSPAVLTEAVASSSPDSDDDLTDAPGTSFQHAIKDDQDSACVIETTEMIRSGDKEQFLHDLNQFPVASKPFMDVFVAGEEKLFTSKKLDLHIHEDGSNFEEKLEGLRDIHLFKNPEGLEMEIPEDLNLTTLMDFLPQIKVGVINSYTRGTENTELSELVRLINQKEEREVAWNLLSFEMSHTDCRIARDFKEPLFVRENSIVNRLEERLKEELQAIETQLQEDQTAEKMKLKKEKAAIGVQLRSMPKFQKFLLVTMANSYTDIHVDPSGTCVYYHVKEGRKIFYVAPPTERNLEIYKRYEGSDPPEKWIVEELFDELQRVEIKKGYTAFIPAGYIHAVYTPEDSIVFGGNFLMDGHIDRHFEMTAVEEGAVDFGHIGVEHTFPNFENVMWRYADKVVIERLQQPNPHWKDAISPLLLRENLDVAKMSSKKFNTKLWYSEAERTRIVGQLKRLHNDYTRRKIREDRGVGGNLGGRR